jgi:hypothetical protein
MQISRQNQPTLDAKPRQWNRFFITNPNQKSSIKKFGGKITERYSIKTKMRCFRRSQGGFFLIRLNSISRMQTCFEVLRQKPPSLPHYSLGDSGLEFGVRTPSNAAFPRGRSDHQFSWRDFSSSPKADDFAVDFFVAYFR